MTQSFPERIIFWFISTKEEFYHIKTPSKVAKKVVEKGRKDTGNTFGCIFLASGIIVLNLKEDG